MAGSPGMDQVLESFLASPDEQESEEQLGILRRMGCDQYQGFHCSPPIPADEFERMMRLGPMEPATSSLPENTSDTIMARALRNV